MQIQNLTNMTSKKQLNPNKQLSSQLRQKRSCISKQAQDIQNQIKTYFSQISMIMMNRQQILCKQLNSKQLSLYTQIDRLLPMSEGERRFYFNQVDKILNQQFSIEFQQLGMAQKFINKIVKIKQFNLQQSNDIPTNKKNLMSLQLDQNKMQQSEKIVQYLQQKIQKMMIKESKLRTKIDELQKGVLKATNKGGFKKKDFQNPEKSYISQLCIERVQGEKKILSQINRQNTAKMQQLIEENSLIKEQLKKWSSRSQICSLQEGCDFTYEHSSIQKSSILEQCNYKIQNLQCQLKRQKYTMQQLLKDNQAHKQLIQQIKERNQSLKRQIQKLTHQNQMIYKDYQLCCKIKVQNEESYLVTKNKFDQLSEKYNKIEEINYLLSTDNSNLKALNEIATKKVQELQEEIKLSKQSFKKRISEAESQLHNYINIVDQKQREIQKFLEQQNNTKRCFNSKFIEMKNQNTILAQSLEERQKQLMTMRQQISGMQATTMRINRQKQSTNKKQFNKKKKEIDRQHQQEIKSIKQQFAYKIASLKERLQNLQIQSAKIKNQYQNRLKIHQSRFKLFQEISIRNIQQLLEKNKGKVAIDVLQKYIDGISNFSMKNSQIKQLKQQIGQLKKARPKQDKMTNYDQKLLELQIFQAQKRAAVSKSEIQVSQLNETIKYLEQKLQKQVNEKKALIERLSSEKIKNKEMKQLVSSLQSKQKSSENAISVKQQDIKRKYDTKLEKLQSQVKSLKNLSKKVSSQCSDLQGQIKSKKQLISKYKEEITKKDNQIQLTKTGYQTQARQIEKLKRNINDILVKERLFDQMKEKYEQSKDLQKQVTSLKKALQQKQKRHKFQLSQKDVVVRKLKDQKQELRQEKSSTNNQQIADLKEKLKRIKNDIDRKDQLLKRNKEKAQQEIQSLKETIIGLQTERDKLRSDNEGVVRKLQSSKIRVKKQQSRVIILLTILRRIYQRVWKSVNARKQNKQVNCYQFEDMGSTQQSPEKYNQGLSMLGISPSLLSEYLVAPSTAKKGLKTSKIEEKVPIDRIQTLLRDEDIRVQQIMNQFSVLLQK